MDYEIIQDFIKFNPVPFKKIKHNISTKEKKFLAPYIDNILSDIEDEKLD